MRYARFSAWFWLATFSIVVFVTACPQPVAHAADFWLSTSGGIGQGAAQPSNPDDIPTIVHSTNASTGTVFVWGRPGNGTTLDNWSLRVKSTDASILSFTGSSIDAFNPVLSDPPSEIVRWEFVNEPLEQTTMPDGSAVLGELQGFSLFGNDRVGVGIPASSTEPLQDDPHFDPAINAWLLAQVDYSLTGVVGETEIYLQIGSQGISESGQPSNQSSVVFGSDTLSPLNGQSQRLTDSATPEAFIMVAEITENADFDENGAVDGADLLRWQRNFGLSTGATLGDGDANGDSAVDDIDLSVWESHFGTAAAVELSVTIAVPEPQHALVSLAVFATGFFIHIRKRRLFACG